MNRTAITSTTATTPPISFLMKFDPQKHHRPFDAAQGRRSLRLPDHDYSGPGAYFITLVTHGRECLFGEVRDGAMHLSAAGQVVWDVWRSLPERYPQIEPGAAVVMPDHFHGIVIISVRAIHELPLQRSPLQRSPQQSLTPRERQVQRRRMTLPLVVGYLKMNSAKRINELSGSQGLPVWQRNYYEHIIRDDEEHRRIHSYIEANVANWDRDHDNPGK